MHNIALLLFFMNTAALLGWTFRPNEYTRLCQEFDRIGAETVFLDAQSLINNPINEFPPLERFIEVYPITNSLSVFGNSARVGSNSISFATAGMGSVRMGITIIISSDKIEKSTAYFCQSQNYETYQSPIYPIEDRD